MGEVGVFAPDERMELLDGEIVAMSPIGPRHAGTVNGLAADLFGQLLGRATIIVQNPVRLLPRSEPQPDLLVARFRRDSYRSAHPTAEDTLLLIEVADTSLATDRAVKLPIYARQGIVEVWIVDLAGDVVHVHTDPADGEYREIRTVRRGGSLTPTTLPGTAFAVDTILG